MSDRSKLKFANEFLRREGLLEIAWVFTWKGKVYRNFVQGKLSGQDDLDLLLSLLKEDINKIVLK